MFMTPYWLLPSLVLILGYLLGSIPFGLLLTRVTGAGDLRQIGSGNIGATNVLRTGRKGLAAATLLLDLLKGVAAVLVGALVVGDSVRYSLRRQALQRVGAFKTALACGDRFVTDELAANIREELDARVCPTLLLQGVANRSEGRTRAGIVDVLGVEHDLFTRWGE